MRAFSLIALTISLSASACAQSESETVQAKETEAVTVEQIAQTKSAPVEQPAQIQPVDELINAARNAKSTTTLPDIDCQGVFQQGGAVLCKTIPGATANVGGIDTIVDGNGYFVAGFDRDAAKQEFISVSANGKKIISKSFSVKPREYDVQRIDGLPPSQVSTFTEEQLAHIKASSARKKVGFASRVKHMGFADGFTPAVTGTKSSDFGNQRILNGEPKRPHYGVDIAAPEGTPIYAPADGIVSLADDDLYFEGAMVLIDHGQGLISMYLHMSDIDVAVGQKVKRGDQLGAVGAKGRATGAHLCWRLKWRNRNLDPELLTQWPHD